MLHACVQRFDMTGTIENFLETKHGHKAGKIRSAAKTKKTEDTVNWNIRQSHASDWSSNQGQNGAQALFSHDNFWAIVL